MEALATTKHPGVLSLGGTVQHSDVVLEHRQWNVKCILHMLYDLDATITSTDGLNQETSGYTPSWEEFNRGVLPQYGSSAPTFLPH